MRLAGLVEQRREGEVAASLGGERGEPLVVALGVGVAEARRHDEAVVKLPQRDQVGVAEHDHAGGVDDRFPGASYDG